MRPWREVSHREPCSVCSKPDWCSRSADGNWVACRRLDTGDGIHRVDKAGVDYWLYRRDGHFRHHHAAFEISLAHRPIVAPPDILHQVYQALLRMLPLAQRHRQNLHERGLSDTEITRRQYRTLPAHGRAEFARRLVYAFGPEVCAQIPGLYVKEQDGRRWWSLAGAAGLLIPVRDMEGRLIAFIVRHDDLEPDLRYSSISSKKYGGPGSGAHIHVPLYESASRDMIRLTEGILKADVATVLSGCLTIGLPGVSAWRQALPVLTVLQAHIVALAFDTDAKHNWHVARTLQHTARALEAAGFQLVLERWAEEEGKGVDDLLAAGYVPGVLTGAAMWEAIGTIVNAARLSDPLLQRQRLLAMQQGYLQKHRLPAVDPWLGPPGMLHGIPLAVRRIGEEVARG